MLLKDIINNIKENVKTNFVKFAYIYAPILGIILYLSISRFTNIKIYDEFMSNLINVSGVLAGFLFTALGIIISLPSNKFTSYLKLTGYMKIIYNSMFIGIITLLSSMMLGLFSANNQLVIYIFIMGISETFLSAYYLYKVSYYSEKSK